MAVGTCYAIGNEITGFATTGSVIVGSAATRPQSASRCTIHIAPSAAADPPANSFQFNQNWGPASTFYLLGVFTWSALGGSADPNATLVEFKDASGVARLMIRGAGSGAVKISTRNAAGSFVDLATSAANSMPLTGLTPITLNVEVIYSSTGSGFVEVRLNNNVVVSYTGANTTDGATQLAQAAFCNCNVSNGIDWSEEWVSSVTLLNATVLSLPPLAAGAVQTWAGVVADINSVSIVDTSFISDGTAGDLSGWTVATTLPTGAWQIQAFAQELRLSVGNTGPQHADFYLRTAGTDNVFGDSLAPPNGSFENFSGAIWGESPVTSAAWTLAEFTAGLNFGVKSLA
jgi:hypothetical protein